MAGDGKRRRLAEAERAFLRVIMSQELDEKADEHTPQHFHHHACSNLFGCGDEKGIGILRDDIKAICRREDVGAASSCRQVASWAL